MPSTTAMPDAERDGAAELAVVQEVPVWLEVNGDPTVTWMCTPEQLEELVVGWLHGEGYIGAITDLKKLRPCATDLGFWADVDPARVISVKGENRQRVLASGCGAVSVFMADPRTAPVSGGGGIVPDLDTMVARLTALGGTLDRAIKHREYGRIANMADPFGNGFDLIAFSGSGYDGVSRS